MGLFGSPKTTTTTTSTKDDAFQQSGATSMNNVGNSGSQQTGQTTNQSLQTSTPNLPQWFTDLKQGVGSQYGNLFNQFGQMANKPLYGQQQQASFTEALNRQLGGQRQDLMSSLAQRGALNSGNAAQAQTGLALGGVQQLQDYLAKVPLLNQAAQQQGMQGQLQALNGAAGLTMPFGTTTQSNSVQDMISNLLSQFNNMSNGTSNQSGTSNSSGSSTETKQTSGGLLQSILGGIINAGMGALTGGMSTAIGGLFGGMHNAGDE